jgi:ubiquinone/menaquinone biosynthesis C-methylase UbiE
MTAAPPPGSGSGPGSGRAVDKGERLAKVYDAEILPTYAGRFAALALRALEPRPGARLLEVGCATGDLTMSLARRLDADSTLAAVEETPALLALARAKVIADAGVRGRVSLDAGAPGALSVADAAFDAVVSNLAVAEAPDRAAALSEAVRALRPGGQLVLTLPLRGTWAEFLDIYRDVLRENGRAEALAALDGYVAGLPDGDAAVRLLEDAGLGDVTIAVDRWEILFKSGREFFFAPLIELGPLSRWKQLAGRGDEMQDIFFFTKEAIDTYFKGSPFAVSVVGAAVAGRKPASSS